MTIKLYLEIVEFYIQLNIYLTVKANKDILRHKDAHRIYFSNKKESESSLYKKNKVEKEFIVLLLLE